MKIRTCPFCGVEVKKSPHIYHCKENKEKLNKNEIKFKYLKFNFSKINKELLKSLYIDEKNSLPDISKKFDIDVKSICFLLDYFGIKIRTISDSTKLSKDKKIKTCLDRYGVEWYSQTDSAKKKKKLTFKDKYGYDNIWKSDYFKNNLDKYYYEKHGVNRSQYLKDKWIKLESSERSRIIKDWYSKCSYSSGLEKRIKNIVDDLGVEYKSNVVINDKSFDIVYGKKIIEVQGDFWHANPSKYKENDVLNFPGEKVLAKDLWIKDKIKLEMIENMGYEMLYLWESDINKKTDDELLHIILEFFEI